MSKAEKMTRLMRRYFALQDRPGMEWQMARVLLLHKATELREEMCSASSF